MYLNKAFIIGNLTRDPELRSLPSGVPVASFGVATNRVWRDRDGNRQEGTEFHNVVVFSRQAETTAQYLRKGSMVFIEGRMQTRSWDGQDGQKRYRTEVVADRIQFGPRGGEGGGNNQSGSTASQGNNGGDVKRGNSSQSEPPVIEYPSEDEINPEDIPF